MGKLKVVSKSYTSVFPFELSIYYMKGVPRVYDVLEEAVKEDLLLLPLLKEISKKTEAFVFNQEDDINIKLFFTDSVSVDTIMHECDHVVFRIFDIMGAEVCTETEEFHAYLLELIFREVYTILTQNFKLDPPMFDENAI